MSKYDIIIIGSGLGGLECGAILSKEGYNVCVLEKNELFGGCFQTYRRKGHLLDTGIHYIGSLDEGQVMNQFFRYVGIMDHLKVRKLDENAFDKIFYKNRVYDYAMGYERFINTLCQSFPHEKENLRQYTTSLKEVGNLISVDNLKKGIISTEGMKFFNTSAAGMIDKITTNPDLQSVLASKVNVCLGCTLEMMYLLSIRSAWFISTPVTWLFSTMIRVTSLLFKTVPP